MYIFFTLKGQDVNDDADFEDDGRSVFSRRKLESNWDRYEASEQDEQDVLVQRGTDYHALMGSAGKQNIPSLCCDMLSDRGRGGAELTVIKM